MRTKVQLTLTLKWLLIISPYPILLWFYFPILDGIWKRIATDENYSFGLLLPFVIAYIIYIKWPQIQRSVFNPTWVGLAIMVIGFTLNFFWTLGAATYLGNLSFFLVVIGLLMMQFGFQLIRLLAFPMLLVFLMLPLPNTLLKAVTFRLQLLSSFLAAKTLSSLGHPVFLHGNVIDLGYRQLQVVEACSGMGYLITALILAIIFCYFYQHRYWKVSILLLSVVPASVLANTGRLVTIAFFPIFQEGFWHMAIGLIIFIFIFFYLMLINMILDKLDPPSVSQPARSAPTPRETSASYLQRKFNWYHLAGLTVVILAIPITFHLNLIQSIPLPRNFDQFPLQIGPWEGRRSYVEPAILKILQTNEYLEASYANSKFGPVSLWIAYYPDNYRQKGFQHNPEICMVGGGWKIVREEQTDLAPGLPVKYILLEQSGKQQIVYYWYLHNNRWIASEISFKTYLGLDALFKKRNDGALVRLITPAAPNVTEAQARLRDFGQYLIPALQQFFQLDEKLGTTVVEKKAEGKKDHGYGSRINKP